MKKITLSNSNAGVMAEHKHEDQNLSLALPKTDCPAFLSLHKSSL